MKKIVCEMCEGSEFLKQDGMFVCQGCGMKYSAEEAKKIMVEDDTKAPAEKVNTVKVDASDELSNLYQLARRARENNNSLPDFIDKDGYKLLNIIFNNALLNVTEKRKGDGIFYGVNDKYTVPGA